MRIPASGGGCSIIPQIKVTPDAREPLAGAALATSSVTRKQHFLNHALQCSELHSAVSASPLAGDAPSRSEPFQEGIGGPPKIWRDGRNAHSLSEAPPDAAQIQCRSPPPYPEMAFKVQN